MIVNGYPLGRELSSAYYVIPCLTSYGSIAERRTNKKYEYKIKFTLYANTGRDQSRRLRKDAVDPTQMNRLFKAIHSA